MISRRTFLHRTAALAACFTLESAAFREPTAVPALDPSTLRPWVDPLPIPAVAVPIGIQPDPDDPTRNLPLYRVTMRELRAKIHRDLPRTRVWGFNNSLPGSIFETRAGQGMLVECANELPLRHFLPIDFTIHGAEPDKPEVRSVIHLHGGKTPAESDGYPEDWYCRGWKDTVRAESGEVTRIIVKFKDYSGRDEAGGGHRLMHSGLCTH